MDERPLRLGDIVDDYCPRERRITNHAIVALVGDEIRQTRCTTCEVEHAYKEAKVPRRMPTLARAGSGGDPPPADTAAGQLVPRAATAKTELLPESDAATNGAGQPASNGPEAADRVDEPPSATTDTQRDVDGWLAHRPLIRATLPRVDGEPPVPRPIPEFTMHKLSSHGRAFRHGHGRQGGNGQSPNGFGGPDRHGNGPAHPGPGGGRRRRRRGGRHKRPR